jgi:hypothetical protein
MSQIKAANRIFAEHRYLKSQHEILMDQVSLYRRSGVAKDMIIQSKQQQIGALEEIIAGKDMIISNSGGAINDLKARIEAEQKDHKKYLFLGCGVGAAIASVLFAVL